MLGKEYMEEMQKAQDAKGTDGKVHKLKVLTIIHEVCSDRDIYRVMDFTTGLINDVTLDWVTNAGLSTDEAERIRIKNLERFTGSFKKGINDFETWCRMNNRLDLLSEYDTEKNPKMPDEISKGSIERVWWKCSNGHEWESHIKNRTKSTYQVSCPMCQYDNGKYHTLVKGDNDLESYCKANGFEHILKEYSDKNDKKPSEVARGDAQYKAIWNCPKCKREYVKVINNRFKGQACPYCSMSGTSIPELILYRYMSDVYSSVLYRVKINGWEADIAIPETNTIIDYRGVVWHSDEHKKEIDAEKEQVFKEEGYRQIIIWEDWYADNEVISDNEMVYKGNSKNLEWMLQILSGMLGITKDILNSEYVAEIEKEAEIKKNSHEVLNNITITHPDVARRWDYIRNDEFKPEYVTYGTALKAWFICDTCGRSYYSMIRKQTMGQGCKYCNNPVPYTGINDVVTTHPDIVKILDPNRPTLSIEELKRLKANNLTSRVYILCPECNEQVKRQVSLSEITTSPGLICKHCGEQILLKQAPVVSDIIEE